jgi:hypothetical protein
MGEQTMMTAELIQPLIDEARRNGWPFFPPRFFGREQVAHWLAIDVKTLNARLQRTGLGKIPHWSGLLDIEVIANALVMRNTDEPD